MRSARKSIEPTSFEDIHDNRNNGNHHHHQQQPSTTTTTTNPEREEIMTSRTSDTLSAQSPTFASPGSMKTPLLPPSHHQRQEAAAASTPLDGPGGKLREWADFFGRDANDFVQTASLPFLERSRLFWNHFFNSWSPCARRRFVVANPRPDNTGNPKDDVLKFFPPNVVNNRRYSIFSFWWLCLIDQFRFSVFNIYFLALACSQFVPELQVGMMFTYFAPLAFVVALSMLKEGYDDIKRWQQDRLINSAQYQRLIPGSNCGEFEAVTAEDIRVGDIIRVEAGKRIPADLILLHTTETTGSCFVRTDQLDGETDWKPRHPIKATLRMDAAQLAKTNIVVEVEVPHRDIYSFEATYVVGGADHEAIKVGVDVNSTLWTGCSVAAGSTLGLVIFTGVDTRVTLNAERASTKVSLIDRELNYISILCFIILFVLSILLVVQQLSIHLMAPSRAFISLFRFQILMSAIIPISLRVNLDIARIWYAIGMMWDRDKLPGLAVRNTNIPEELGRLHYLFSDKTGTLTKNEMHFRTLHLDDNFALEDTEVDDIKTALELYFAAQHELQQQQQQMQQMQVQRNGQNLSDKNLQSGRGSGSDGGSSPVTPQTQQQQQQQQRANSSSTSPTSTKNSPLQENQDFSSSSRQPQTNHDTNDNNNKNSNNTSTHHQHHHHHHTNIVGYNKKQSQMIGRSILALGLCHQVTPVEDEDKPGEFTYQAASPDEIAMVQFASRCGIRLLSRDTCRRDDEETGDVVEGEMKLQVHLRNASSSFPTPKNENREKYNYNNNNNNNNNDNDDDNAHDHGDSEGTFTLEYDVLRAFPFSSERKCMSIIIRNKTTRQIQFLMKGADVKMHECIVKNDSTSWLEDRCFELAKTGRRTLVFACRDLTVPEYKHFAKNLAEASAAPSNRAQAVEKVMAQIERNLTLIGVTGVEDLLQDNVVRTLEHLGVCGIKVWMLTGDKVETARCIGRSTKLIRTDLVETLVAKTEAEADELIDQLCAVYAPRVLREVRKAELRKKQKQKQQHEQQGGGNDTVSDLGTRSSTSAPPSGLNNTYSGNVYGATVPVSNKNYYNNNNNNNHNNNIKMAAFINSNSARLHRNTSSSNAGGGGGGQPNFTDELLSGRNGGGLHHEGYYNDNDDDDDDDDDGGGRGGGGGVGGSGGMGHDSLGQVGWALVTDGTTLKFCLPGPDHPRQKKFLGLTSKAESVVVARCSPTQKAQVVQAMIQYRGPNVRVAAIGDGGNDVSMIRAAHVGIGLEGLEGKQASLAADYSIPKFAHCEWLITWHGRCSYLRTSSLAQFIIHRGVVYAIVQAVFSLIFNGSTMSVFNGYLMTLYATVYTMAPVFALVLNEDSFESDVEDYPELYRWLLKSRAFNMRSFLQWMWLSFFQGGIMMYLTVRLFADELFQIVSITFTTLVLTELFYVGTCFNFKIMWQQRRMRFLLFFAAELLSFTIYFASVFVLPDTFDQKFFLSETFWENVGIISAASIVPVAVLIFIEGSIRQWLKNRRKSTSRGFLSMF